MYQDKGSTANILMQVVTKHNFSWPMLKRIKPSCCDFCFLQANLSNANLEGALATGNTSFKGSNITGAGNGETTSNGFLLSFAFVVNN